MCICMTYRSTGNFLYCRVNRFLNKNIKRICTSRMKPIFLDSFRLCWRRSNFLTFHFEQTYQLQSDDLHSIMRNETCLLFGLQITVMISVCLPSPIDRYNLQTNDAQVVEESSTRVTYRPDRP